MKRLATAALVLVSAWGAPAQSQPAVPEAPVVSAVTHEIAVARIREKLAGGTDRLLRPDGYIYGVDVGQGMIELAKAGDRDGYRKLRALAVGQFVQFDRQNPYIDGFVAWRIKPGQKPDASGTAEALRIAEGLLAGATGFGEREDARIASQVLSGYARHGYVDQGLWFVRNYFNFGTRAFSPNSYIVNYDLDLVSRWKAPEGAELAKNVRTLLLVASRPNGLMNEIIQPEVATAIPLPYLRTFAPDGVHSIANSCMVLERALSLPERGRVFLDTVVRAVSSTGPTKAAEFFVPPYLDGKNGMAITRDYPADIFVQGCLARLSHRLAHPQAAAFRLSYLKQLDERWGDGRKYDLLYLSEVARTLRIIEGR
jgi:hypothetical protein